jgi:hypothetical protein
MNVERLRVACVVVVAAMLGAACSRGAEHSADSDSAGEVTTTDSVAAVTPVDTTAADSIVPMRASATGLGPLLAGATLAQADGAIGDTLVPPPGADTSGCYYAAWPHGPDGVRVMVEAGRIARIDVSNDSIPTMDGVNVGNSEASVLTQYAGRVNVTPQKYTDGHYLTVTPRDPADSNFRIVLETEHGRVTRYRVGRLPAVGYVEGCG